MFLAQDKEGLKEFQPPIRPAYGVMILQDKIVADPDSNLITEFRKENERFTTYNDHVLSGTIVDIADNFLPNLVGCNLKIGDRIMCSVNKSVPINFYGKYNLALVRETDITAKIDPEDIYESEF